MRLALTDDVEVISGDRRRDCRYRVDLRFRYQVAGKSGCGMVRDMSRGGVLVGTDRELRVGAPVELVIQWPFRLQGVCPLELVMEGEVVRVSGFQAAVQSSRYQFRSSTFEGVGADKEAGERLIATA